jgi:predicted Zn-dependent protease
MRQAPMNPITAQDEFHLQAAEGWLGLGSHVEADKELDEITPGNRGHAAVLKLRWEVQAMARRWEDCLTLAEAVASQEPTSPFGWIHQSYALHELKRTEEAYKRLLQVAQLFKEHPLVFYNLACYCAQLGKLEEARQHLDQASRLSGNPAKMKEQAKQDPDLLPLWKKSNRKGS